MYDAAGSFNQQNAHERKLIPSAIPLPTGAQHLYRILIQSPRHVRCSSARN